jgi:predicted metal-dependent hydrolase
MISVPADQLPHPMDNIPIRNLRFDTKQLSGQSALWSHTEPDFSMFINALGIHVPYFERFLVAVFRGIRADIKDADLLRDVKGIIGQEAHHAFNFVGWNKVMNETYPRVSELEADAESHFASMQSKRSTFFQVGYVAGYETFTFLAGAIILDRYEELMGDADPVMRALWVWHQVEEVEHGAVAFDVYNYFYADREWARKFFVLLAFAHITKETLRAYLHMGHVEGFWRAPVRGFKAAKFFFRFALDLARSALPVLKRNYHPRSHPICNEHQNRIALAWRERYDAGLTTLAIEQGDLTHALEVATGGAGS